MKLEIIRGIPGYGADLIRDTETKEGVVMCTDPALSPVFAACPEFIELVKELASAYSFNDTAFISDVKLMSLCHKAALLISEMEKL